MHKGTKNGKTKNSCNVSYWIMIDNSLHNDDLKLKADELSRNIIGAAIEVHKTLGPGLLESVYEECLCYELTLRGIPFERQVMLPIMYKGLKLEYEYRVDLVVDDSVIVELKAVENIDKVHEAQLLTYLRLRNSWLGLIINFNTVLLKDGIRRMVNR